MSPASLNMGAAYGLQFSRLGLEKNCLLHQRPWPNFLIWVAGPEGTKEKKITFLTPPPPWKLNGPNFPSQPCSQVPTSKRLKDTLGTNLDTKLHSSQHRVKFLSNYFEAKVAVSISTHHLNEPRQAYLCTQVKGSLELIFYFYTWRWSSKGSSSILSGYYA